MAPRRTKAGRIDDAGSIAVLAAPARQEIIDTIEALGGEASVAAVAAQLGKPADGLYYHLRLLEKARLVEEIADDGDGRRYRTRLGGAPPRLHYTPGANANAAAVGRVANGLLRIAARDFSAALAREDVVAEGSRRELWASRSKGWVGDTELAEINRLLERLLVLLQGTRGKRRDRLLSLAWVLAPLEAKALRRQADTAPD